MTAPKSKIWWIPAILALMTVLAPSSSRADLCETPDAFKTAVAEAPKMAKWRGELTNPNQEGAYSNTRRSRENTLKRAIEDMSNDVLQESTPLMRTEFADGVDTKVLVETGGYKSGIIDRVEVSGVGETAAVDVTMLLPVSGHVGVANAKKWAVSDTYDIVWESGGKRVKLISGAKSLGIVTAQEVRIPLRKGQVVKVSYYRSGSLGPLGFIEGRVIELTWDGT